MLQWMGGSRRKVATSRKSMQKRQKQYFEQRKLQQQQQMVGTESYNNGVNICGQHQKEHRSLDILSLLNLSTTAQESRFSCPSGGREDLDINASKLKYNITRGPPTFLTNTVTAADSVEIKEARSPSGYQVETISPNKAFFSASKSYNNAFNRIDNKENLQRTTTDQREWQDTELSVFDLLGDDGPIDNSERSPVTEAHVAFSVEGLGKVGTKTPIHSPQQPGRIFRHGCSSPCKAARRLNSSKNFNHVLDDFELEVDQLMQDINMPPSGSSLDFSTGIMDSYGNRYQKLSTVKNHTQLDVHSSRLKSPFAEAKNFYDIGNSDEDIWEARSQFLDDNDVDEREGDVSWKNWPCQMNGNSAEFLKYGDHEISDYAFEGPHLLKKRDFAMATDKFNILESPASEHRKSKKDHDFMTSSGTRHPTLGRNFDFRDVTRQPDWSYFVNEDARDSLSLLSEESCSSSAVRGEATNNSPSQSTIRQRRKRHGNAFGSPGNKYGVKNTFSKEPQYKNRDDIQQGNNACGSGKCTRTIPFKSKPRCHVNSPFQEKLGSTEIWLFEDGHTPVDINSGFSSFSYSATKFPSPGSKLSTEDPFDAIPLSELHNNAKSSLHRSKHGETVECSPFGCFISEKFSFCQPFSHITSHGSPIFSRVGFGPAKPDSSPDTGLEGMPPDSSHVAGPHRETPFVDLSVQGSVSEDEESKSKFETANCELGKQNCIGILSEKEEAMDASNSYDNSLECKVAKDGTLELRETLETTVFPEHAEDTS